MKEDEESIEWAITSVLQCSIDVVDSRETQRRFQDVSCCIIHLRRLQRQGPLTVEKSEEYR